MRKVILLCLAVLVLGSALYSAFWNKKADVTPIPVPFTYCEMKWDAANSGLFIVKFKNPGQFIPPDSMRLMMDDSKAGWVFTKVSPAGATEAWYKVTKLNP